MKYTLKPTTQFKRDLKKAQKQNKNLDLFQCAGNTMATKNRIANTHPIIQVM